MTDLIRPMPERKQMNDQSASPLEELRGSVLLCKDPFQPLGEDDSEALKDLDEK